MRCLREHVASAWLGLLSICALIVSCSTDPAAPISQPKVAVGAASFETANGPESQSEANSCTHGTNSPNVPTGTLSVTTTSSCNMLNPSALGSNGSWSATRRDQVSDGSYTSTSPSGGWPRASCTGNPDSNHAYSCNVNFTGLACSEVGDLEGVSGTVNHFARWLGEFEGESTSSISGNCEGNPPTIALDPGTILIGATAQATTNCNNASQTSYLSTNPSVATVNSSGVVTGVHSGVAAIQVECFARAANASISVVTRVAEGGTPNNSYPTPVTECGYYVIEISYDGGFDWYQLGDEQYLCS
jgi:hypothetical protein